MSLINLIIRVAKIKSRDLILIAVNTAVIILFYYLLFENSESIYPLILSAFIVLIYFLIEVIRYRSFEEKLYDSKRSPSYSSNNLTYYEEEVLQVISEIHEEYQNKIYTLKQQIKEREILYSQWIHNMKTSITVIDLVCEKSNGNEQLSKSMEDIKEENNMLKKNLEECLNLIRLDDFSRDYITDRCNLRELVSGVVNSKKRDFIYKGVFPKLNINEDIYVYTDKKWCSYIIEQAIANAIKYSKTKSGDKIEIWYENKGETSVLYIKDYGIGICEEDLSRVFNPFFTGNNGRKYRNATGIGLYMVKLVSQKLGHKVEIESKIDVGTTIKILFYNLS